MKKFRKSRRKSRKSRKSRKRKQYGKGPDECGICLEDIAVDEEKYTLPCKHTFHKSCLNPWCWRNPCTCPKCRAVIPAGIIPSQPVRQLDLVVDEQADARRFARWARISPPPDE